LKQKNETLLNLKNKRELYERAREIDINDDWVICEVDELKMDEYIQDEVDELKKDENFQDEESM